MLLSNLTVNQEGHLLIGGVDTVELAKKYGTPVYIIDEERLRCNCQMFKEAVSKHYQGKGQIYYASKALSCKEIIRIMKEENLGIDVVSMGELFTALSVDFPTDRICFHGNNKTLEEIQFALKNKVGRIIVDNQEELHSIHKEAEALNMKPKIMLRIKPGVEAHTHAFIRTGQIDSKFGFALETGEALKAALEALQMKHVQLTGFHCHIGSQIFEIQPFVLAAQLMIDFMKTVYEQTGVCLEELNLGGGFGIRYQQEDIPMDINHLMKSVSDAIEEKIKGTALKFPFISLEPGRSIIGDVGITLYTVGARKEIPGVRTYITVDGGMTDNPRYALYHAAYDVVVAQRANEPKNECITLAGKCCESGDLIGEDMPLQHAEKGDIIAVLCTGAYNYAMASHYNRIPNPPIVMVNNKKDRLIVKRETLEDLLRNDF